MIVSVCNFEFCEKEEQQITWQPKKRYIFYFLPWYVCLDFTFRYAPDLRSKGYIISVIWADNVKLYLFPLKKVCVCARARMCVYVIEFNVTFKGISVISWRCLLVADWMLYCRHIHIAFHQVTFYSRQLGNRPNVLDLTFKCRALSKEASSTGNRTYNLPHTRQVLYH